MIEKIIFFVSLFSVGYCSAQKFQILDHNDVDITNTTHYEYGSKSSLGLTKFHVKNLTGSQQSFAVRVVKEYVPYSNSGLQICFGSACYSASATVNGTQIINNGEGDTVLANAIYTDLKVAPVTWMWNTPVSDSAVWRVTVFDENNTSDSASVLVIYRDRNWPVSVYEADKLSSLNAYPNPTNGLVQLKLSEKIQELIIYNSVGKVINDIQIKGDIVDFRDKPAGIYFIKVRTEKNYFSIKKIYVVK